MYETNVLLDTGAVQSAMSEAKLRKITTAHPNVLIREIPAPDFKNNNAKRNLVHDMKYVLQRFFLSRCTFEETFVILSTMGMVLLGMSFVEKFSETIDIKNHLVHHQNFTMQVRKNSKIKDPNIFIRLQTTQKMVIDRSNKWWYPSQLRLPMFPRTSPWEATPAIGKRDATPVSPAVVSLTEGKTMLLITNPHSHTNTLDSYVVVSKYEVMTPQQAVNPKSVPHAPVLLLNSQPEEHDHILSQLFHEKKEIDWKRWYPTPETCDDPSKLNEIEKRCSKEIIIFLEAKSNWTRQKAVNNEKNCG